MLVRSGCFASNTNNSIGIVHSTYGCTKYLEGASDSAWASLNKDEYCIVSCNSLIWIALVCLFMKLSWLNLSFETDLIYNPHSLTHRHLNICHQELCQAVVLVLCHRNTVTLRIEAKPWQRSKPL